MVCSILFFFSYVYMCEVYVYSVFRSSQPFVDLSETSGILFYYSEIVPRYKVSLWTQSTAGSWNTPAVLLALPPTTGWLPLLLSNTQLFTQGLEIWTRQVLPRSAFTRVTISQLQTLHINFAVYPYYCSKQSLIFYTAGGPKYPTICISSFFLAVIQCFCHFATM